MMTPEQRAELRKLLDAATPRPWRWVKDGQDWYLAGPEHRGGHDLGVVLYGYGPDYSTIEGTDEDKALIVEAVNAIDDIEGRALANGLMAARYGIERDEARHDLGEWAATAGREKARADAAEAAVERVRVLVADWQANGNSRELADPTADTWHEAARQLLRALDGGE